jgi:hypothetical protein
VGKNLKTIKMQEDNHVSQTYFKIHNGRVVKEWYSEEKVPPRFKDENGSTAEAVKTQKLNKRVTPQSGKTVFFKNYIFKGVITNVTFKLNERLDEPQMDVNFELNHDSVLTVKAGSSYHKSFLVSMQNFSKGEEITFNPYNFTTKEGKKKVGISFKDQAGEKILPFYTKDDPKDLPPPTKKTKKKNGQNETVWNWDAQEEFLEAKFEEWLAQYVVAKPEASGPVEETQSDQDTSE